MISQDDIDAMTEEVETLPTKTKALTHFMKTLVPGDFVAGHIGSLITKCFYAGWDARKSNEFARIYGHDDQAEYIKAMEDFITDGIRIRTQSNSPDYLSHCWVEDTEWEDPTGLITKLIKRKDKEYRESAKNVIKSFFK